MIVRLFPAIALISVGFVLVKLNKTNELMAMQVSGISMYRILAPLFITVGILSLLVTGNQEFLIPAFAGKLERFKTITFDQSELKELFTKDRTNDILMRVASYDIVEETMYSIFILKNLGDDEYITITAKEGKWIGDNTWYLTDLAINDYADDKWIPPTLEEKEYFLETEIGPDDMREKERETNLISIFQLRTLAEKDPGNPRYPVYFQSRLAYPFVAPVLVLLGIPFIVGFQGRSDCHRLHLLCVQHILHQPGDYGKPQPGSGRLAARTDLQRVRATIIGLGQRLGCKKNTLW
jgi:lipopolysaccharide export system permease protein